MRAAVARPDEGLVGDSMLGKRFGVRAVVVDLVPVHGLHAVFARTLGVRGANPHIDRIASASSSLSFNLSICSFFLCNSFKIHWIGNPMDSRGTPMKSIGSPFKLMENLMESIGNSLKSSGNPMISMKIQENR